MEEMARNREITQIAINCVKGNWSANAVAMTLVIAAVIFIMPCCQRTPVMAHTEFKHLPSSGWLYNSPLSFMPEYDDSTLAYSLIVAIRHDNSFRYRNLSLVVDLVADDSVVTRSKVNLALADEYGNWTGGGFGALYQDTVTIAPAINPGDACRVVVWPAMAGCDTLCGLVNLGLITRPLPD